MERTGIAEIRQHGTRFDDGRRCHSAGSDDRAAEHFLQKIRPRRRWTRFQRRARKHSFHQAVVRRSEFAVPSRVNRADALFQRRMRGERAEKSIGQAVGEK